MRQSQGQLQMQGDSRVGASTQTRPAAPYRQSAAGDKAARDKLLTSNMRFVIKIASQYLNKGLEYEDLISEGYLGLMKALDHFDVSKGYHFISYAVWWIRQSIMKAIVDFGRPIRLPVNKDAELTEIKRACHSVNPNGKKSEEEELEEVALKLGMTKHHIREMLNISQEMISLDSPISGDSDTALVDTVSAGTFTPEDAAIDASLKTEIDKAFVGLDKKSVEVLNMRYGLAELHQLRGRVGRGKFQSYCFLTYSKNITETGISRLKALHQSNDGFFIAEEDLKLRGPGEVFGTAQSGYFALNIADLSRDKEILKTARYDALCQLKQRNP